MAKAYRVVAGLIALLVVVQAAAIAFVTFGIINAVEGGTVVDSDYQPNAGATVHSLGAMIILGLSVLLLAFSFFAKVERGKRLAGFVVLAVVAQVALGITAFGIPAVGIVHGANAFVILGLAVVAARAQRTVPAAGGTGAVPAQAGARATSSTEPVA